MRITLIGFMGSGKSSIGKLLAKKLDVPCIDLDDYIVKKEGKEINKIFAKKGEKYFRKLETKYLKEIVDKYEDAVIPLGGGTPCNVKNWKHINRTKSIYLKRSRDCLFQHLKDKKAKRPLIKDLSNNKLKELIKTKLDSRKADYNRSQIVMKIKKGRKRSEIADHIIEMLGSN